MKFSEYPYVRPDLDLYQKETSQLITTLENADSVEVATHAVTTINALRGKIDTMVNLALIRHSVDTKDAFYDEEDAYWNEYGPHYESLDAKYYHALLHNDFTEDLKAILPETIFLIAEGKEKTFSEEIISLQQQENRLTSQYAKLIASAEITYNGQVYNLSQLGKFGVSQDRAVRKEVNLLSTQFFVDNEEEFDRIYDEMVRVRTEIAHRLGFKDYVEYSYVNMNRWGYNREMVETYRNSILKTVVPLVEKLQERKRQRLGLDHLYIYDLGLTYPNGNATPKGTPDELVAAAQKMYHELSPETGAFFDFMVEHNLLDLVSKKGKQSGGYCTYLMDYSAPFIFSNFNGTSGDVDVLTHEAGHAFQTYQARWIKEPEIIFPNNEAAEIHSMSMEFITWPYMSHFFKEDTAKYKFSHLSSAVDFLPYGVLVDHFQQEVYENPTWTPKERKDAWRRLEQMYLPNRDMSETPDLARGLWWFRQGHIFESPFYYIDYTLAQVCAFQFWKRFNVDHDPKAWEDYLAICKVGGSQTFLEILETGHLVSPFKEGALDEFMSSIDEYLSKVLESDLK